jgi:mucin-19
MTTFPLGVYPRTSKIIPRSFSTASATPVSWVVPLNVTQIIGKCWGGGGAGSGTGYGRGSYPGGSGGFISAVISVVPGETLSVYTGGAGKLRTQNGLFGTQASAGGGGGWSGIFRGSTPLLIAGGGGGGAYVGDNGGRGGGAGGAGGSTQGADGTAVIATMQGLGGTQSAGGAGGSAVQGPAGEAGSYLQGGKGGGDAWSLAWTAGLNGGGLVSDNERRGPGGGGGYYGGGGGGGGNGGSDDFGGGGAGGGSSYFNPTACSNVTNLRSSAGVLTAPGATDLQYIFGRAIGGAANVDTIVGNGGDGLTVILF